MRQAPFVLLLALTAIALVGCGNKGPLQLPATRPAVTAPAAQHPAAKPAAAHSVPAPSDAGH